MYTQSTPGRGTEKWDLTPTASSVVEVVTSSYTVSLSRDLPRCRWQIHEFASLWALVKVSVE